VDFDRDDLRLALATMPCRCGAMGASATIESEGPHFARIECLSCGSWIDWLGWPRDKPSERPRRRQRITKLGEDRCELCLRTRFEIPVPGRLEEHHVIQHSENGSDESGNTRVYCTSCHRLVEWTRTYFGHYHPESVPV